jgi:hypothetical protein
MMKVLCHQFPLRTNYLVQVVIPADMTKEEAARLVAFVMSLTTPEYPTLAGNASDDPLASEKVCL